MPRPPRNWRYRWHVKKSIAYIEADRGLLFGKRIRTYARPEKIEDKVAALERRIKQHGQWARKLTTGQIWQAAEAFQICQRLGVQLLDVIRDHERTHPHGANARKLDQVRVELVEWKRKNGRSERHLLSLDYRLRSLITAIGDKPITAITTQQLEDELDRHSDWNPTTVHSVVQGWKIAFNFAIRRGYLTINPANRLELPKIVHDEPRVFTVDEVRRLLAATLFRDRDPRLLECRAYLAIGMFAGLRPDEIGRLDWRQVDLATATVRVKAANAKDRDRRIVDLAPNLVAWLAPLVRSKGKVIPIRLEVARTACRGVLGLSAWPGDVMRHTFASYHFAEHRNEAATKHQMGHRDDGRIFYNHYCVPVSRTEARRFWSTVPPVALLTA